MKVIDKVIPKCGSKIDLDFLFSSGGGGAVCNDGIVANGCFIEDLSGWTPYQWEWQEPGRAAPIHTTSNTLQQTVPMALDDRMILKFDYHLESGAALYVKFGNPAGINDVVINGPADGAYIGVELAAGDTIQFAITGAATLDDWIDNVAIHEQVWYPDQFTFTDAIDVEPNTMTTSDPVTITGMADDCPVEVTNGEYDVNLSGIWLTDPSRINTDDQIRVRRLSGAYGDNVSATFQAGRTSDTFGITTKEEGAGTGLPTEELIGSYDGVMYTDGSKVLAVENRGNATQLLPTVIAGDASGYYTISGLLTTDTITAATDSAVPTCTTNGQMDFEDGSDYWDVEVTRSSTVIHNFIPGEAGSNTVWDTVTGLSYEGTNFTGAAIVEKTDGSGSSYVNEEGYSTEAVVDIVSNGGFDTADDWITQPSWSIANGVATYDAINNVNNVHQVDVAYEIGGEHTLEFTISGLADGKLAFIKANTTGSGSEFFFNYTKFGNGTYTYNQTIIDADSILIQFIALNNHAEVAPFDIDDVSITVAKQGIYPAGALGMPVQYPGPLAADMMVRNTTCLQGDGTGSITIAGLLTTDTITVADGSDTPTCTTNGTLDVADGDKVFGVTITRAAATWAYYPCQDQLPGNTSGTLVRDVVGGNDGTLTSFTGTAWGGRDDGENYLANGFNLSNGFIYADPNNVGFDIDGNALTYLEGEWDTFQNMGVDVLGPFAAEAQALIEFTAGAEFDFGGARFNTSDYIFNGTTGGAIYSTAQDQSTIDQITDILGAPNEALEFVMRTTGSDETVTLPFTGVNNINIDWGDGTVEPGVVVANPLHVYSTAGDHIVSVTGSATKFAFNNNDQAIKLISVSNFGALGIENPAQAIDCIFYNCSNLESFDEGDTTSVLITCYRGFRGCTKIAYLRVPTIITSACTTLEQCFLQCALLDNANTDISEWDTSNITSMALLFNGATLLDPDISHFNISSLTNATSMLQSTALSTANYDKLLIAWAAQAPNIQSDVAFGAQGVKYSSTAASARAVLTGTYGWIISDDGEL